jgi:surface polysaccharide O-acyltransferase-like enzyme
VADPYWFIPALCYSYLISPIVVRLVQWNWKLVLAISGLIQLILVSIGALGYAGINIPWTAFVTRLFPSWSPFPWLFFFTFGISAGFHIQDLAQWLMKYRTALFVLVLITGFLNILESDYLYRSPLHYPSASIGTITYFLYATTFILWFLALAVVPFSKQLTQFSVKSYGIFLLHYPIIEFTARLIYKVVPQLLAYPFVLVPLLILVGLGLPLIFINAFRKSPVKQYYQYLFS